MAGIIKAERPVQAGVHSPTVAYQFGDMSDAYLDRVRHEAAKIIADARSEAARIRTKAVDDGRQAAMQAVEASLRVKVEQQIQSLLRALSQAVLSIEQSRQAWQKHWEQHALNVAMAIARRIVRRELAHAPDIALDLVRETLHMAAGHQPIVVRMNPDDHATLGPLAEQIVRDLRLIGQATVVADPSIASGGCRVDTDHGAIDGQVATQLARIAEELKS